MHISESVQLGKDSAYAKELTKWEANYTQYGPPGRPFVYQEYPAMMYRATRPKAGGVDADFEGREAADESARARMEHEGFAYGGKAAALAKLERQEFEFAELAANRELNDRKMGEKARAEAAAADESTIQHLPSIPDARDRAETRERGRK